MTRAKILRLETDVVLDRIQRHEGVRLADLEAWCSHLRSLGLGDDAKVRHLAHAGLVARVALDVPEAEVAARLRSKSEG